MRLPHRVLLSTDIIYNSSSRARPPPQRKDGTAGATRTTDSGSLWNARARPPGSRPRAPRTGDRWAQTRQPRGKSDRRPPAPRRHRAAPPPSRAASPRKDTARSAASPSRRARRTTPRSDLRRRTPRSSAHRTCADVESINPKRAWYGHGQRARFSLPPVSKPTFLASPLEPALLRVVYYD